MTEIDRTEVALGEPLESVIVEVLSDAVKPAELGIMITVKFTFPVNPFELVMVTVELVAEDPLMVKESGLALIQNGGGDPPPHMQVIVWSWTAYDTDCSLPNARMKSSGSNGGRKFADCKS